MAFRWRADDGPLTVVFGSSHPSSTKKTTKKNVKVGPPLTKFSGSAHVAYYIKQAITLNALLQYAIESVLSSDNKERKKKMNRNGMHTAEYLHTSLHMP